MPHFRKKPITIEAIKVQSIIDWLGYLDAPKIPHWAELAYQNGELAIAYQPAIGLTVRTLEGPVFARLSDWIIRGVKGELYPCKPDIFAETYDEIDEPEQSGNE